MESKTMLPDSTQSEMLPPSSSSASAARPLPSSGEGSSRSSSAAKTRDKPKKKSKRKSEERGSKTSKKKKTAGKEKSHKDESSSKKPKKENVDLKKAKPEGEDSDLDLETELKPIRDYLKDREKMLSKMFHCLRKANKLQAMLPDVLHSLKTEELQELCLRQLEGMSKSRIMSILAGEEMQSSSDDGDESDLNSARPRPKSAGSAEERQINSEVVDSTSSLTRVDPSVGEAEEAVSPREEEEEKKIKASVEETSMGDADDAPELETEGDAASGNSSWHGNGEGQWDDQVARGNEEYNEMEEEEEEEEAAEGRDVDATSSRASSPRGDDHGDAHQSDCQDERRGDVREEEAAAVRRVKRFRRVKIVRAEGEDCEEGEITSDEVEIDEESDSSCQVGNAQSDAEDAQYHTACPESGVAAEMLANSGNQGNDADNADDSVVDNDDVSARVGPVVGETDAGKMVAGATVPGETVAAEAVTCDDSLIVYAEESLESDTEERCAVSVVENVAGEVESNDSGAVEAGGMSDHARGHNDANKDKRSGPNASTIVSGRDADIEKGADSSTRQSDVAETRASSEVTGKGVTPDPASGGQRGPGGAVGAPGRKVAQQLEVLELELRARAIRSLMKQYGKDVK